MFEILLLISIFPVIAAIGLIIRGNKTKKQTKKMFEHFEKKYPIKNNNQKQK